MILHLSQIFFTDGLTFIFYLLSVCAGSFEPVGDSSTIQIVRRQFDRYAVARQDLDEVHADFAGNVRQDLMIVLQFDLEHGIR